MRRVLLTSIAVLGLASGAALATQGGVPAVTGNTHVQLTDSEGAGFDRSPGTPQAQPQYAALETSTTHRQAELLLTDSEGDGPDRTQGAPQPQAQYA
jgi:hypothetical protein